MRELGHRGGRSRRKGVAEQLPEAKRQSLRQHLRETLDHETIKAAIERALAGGNESARVAAVKFLADLELYRKDDSDGCPRCAKLTAAASAESRERINEWIARLVEHAVRAEVVGEMENEQNSSQATRLVRAAVRKGLFGHEEELEAAVEAAFGRVIDSLSGGFVPGDVSAADAERTLRALEERGLLVRPSRVEELAEERAQARLQALRAEHGLAP
jgi:hypothetical protein